MSAKNLGASPRLLTLVIATAFASAAQAQAPAGAAQAAPPSVVGADLNLSPKRVVFDASTHSSTVYVFNQGANQVSYSVELVDEVMLPDGRIIPATDAAADPATADEAKKLNSAKAFVLATPRRVSLAPHESQTIRVRALPPAGAAAGEYRTHLLVRALPPETTGLTAEQASSKADDKTLAVSITALYSLAIPLIVRQGPPDARGHLDKIVLGSDGRHGTLEMDAVRDGPNSLYGDVEIRSNAGKNPVVGVINGVGVYPEVDHRHVAVTLNRQIASGERLTVTWRDQDAKPGAVLATSDITAP